MSKTTHYLGSLALVMAVVLSVAGSPLLAQGATGTISGVVSDTTGAVLPGVEVTVTNVETTQSRLVITGDEGRYSTPQLLSGNYEVRAELAGFQAGVRQGIRLVVGQQAIVNFSLQVGSISEEVIVTGEAPLVNTTNSALASVIDQGQLADLPLNSRDLTQLSLLNPGVQQVRASISGGVIQGAAGIRVSIGGARIYSTGFLLDGSDVTDVSRGIGPGGAAGSLFGVETVKEFQVITNNFSAEYGRFVGGVMSMVTKSGTNDVHGSVFYFHRNDNLDARNFFDRDPDDPTTRSGKPEFKRHQFGATIGGPIIKDKTFGFFSWEAFRQDQGFSLLNIVPTVDAKLGLFDGIIPPGGGTVDCSGVGYGSTPTADNRCQVPIHPDAQQFIDLYPDPNGVDLDEQSAEFFGTPGGPVNEDFFTGRIDHNFSDSDSFFGRYTIQDGERASPRDGTGSFLPLAATELSNRNQYLTLEWKHIVSPTTINTARFSFTRNRWNETPETCGALITFSFFNDACMGQLELRGPFNTLGLWVEGRNVSNAYIYADDLTLTRGRHDIKMGIAVSRYQTNDFIYGNRGGEWRFSGEVKNLLTGAPTAWFGHVTGSIGIRGVRETTMGLYIQDDFKWRPNFTWNLGLRYDYAGIPTEVNGLLGNLRNPLTDTAADIATDEPYFKNPQNKNFGPRIGFAWDPGNDGKTSVRGGFGLFFETILPYHFANQIRRSPPFSKSAFVPGPAVAAAFPGPPPEALLPGALGFQIAEFEQKQPYAMQWNFTLQREVATDITVTASYVGSKGTHLQAQRMINAAEPEVLPDGRNLWRSGLPRRNTNFTDLDYWEYSTDSTYHGLQLSGRKRFGAGLQFQASYTFGRSLDDNSRVNFSDIQDNFSKFPTDNFALKSVNHGLSDHDIRHNFTFNYVYEIPVQGLDGAARTLLQGWQMNGILSLSTGGPLTVLLGIPSDWDRDRETQVLAARPSIATTSSNSPVNGDGRNANQYFDPTAFTLHDPGFHGNLGRNTLIGPGVATFDFSLFKNTALTEGVNLQFRAEFFNIFNRANFATPGRGAMGVFNGGTTVPVDCSVFGAPAGSGCDQLVPGSEVINPIAGRIDKTNTTSRQIQLGLRITF